MVRFSILSTFCLLLFTTAVAQNAPPEKAGKNIYIHFTVGAALPIGSTYTSLDLSNDKAGYATPGFFVEGGVGFSGKHDFGLGAQIIYQSNPIDNSVKNDTLESMNTPIGSGDWQNIYVMGGPVYKKWIKEKILVDAGCFGGFVVSQSPVISMTNPETKQREDKTATGFALGLSGGVGYLIAKNVTLKASLEYLAAWPTVSKQYGATPYWDPILQTIVYTAPMEFKISKVVSALNIGVGLVIQL